MIRFRRSGTDPEIPSPRTPAPLPVSPYGSGEPDGGQLPRGAGAGERPWQRRECVGEQRRREERGRHCLTDFRMRRPPARSELQLGDGGEGFAFLRGTVPFIHCPQQPLILLVQVNGDLFLHIRPYTY